MSGREQGGGARDEVRAVHRARARQQGGARLQEDLQRHRGRGALTWGGHDNVVINIFYFVMVLHNCTTEK